LQIVIIALSSHSAPSQIHAMGMNRTRRKRSKVEMMTIAMAYGGTLDAGSLKRDLPR